MGFGSGIRKKPIPDPGCRGQKSTGSGSATLIVGIFFFLFSHVSTRLKPVLIYKTVKEGRFLKPGT
jgi:hypothetical protein